MEETEQKKKFPPTLAILLIALLIVLVVFLYANRQQLNNQSSSVMVKKIESPSPAELPTALTLSLDKSQTGFSVGKPIVVTVHADSHEEDVVGFDLLVTYDQTAFSFVKAQAADSAFSLYPRNSSTHLSVTGIKKPTIKDDKPFANTPLLTLTFQPKKQGSYKFVLTPKIGRETTKLVNDKTQVFNPTVESLTVTVK